MIFPKMIPRSFPTSLSDPLMIAFEIKEEEEKKQIHQLFECEGHAYC